MNKKLSRFDVIPPNGKMMLLFDNEEKVELHTPDGSYFRDVDVGLSVQNLQIAFYPIGEELLRKISKSNKVKIAIYDIHGRSEITLEKEDLAFYTELLNKYVD